MQLSKNREEHNMLLESDMPWDIQIMANHIKQWYHFLTDVYNIFKIHIRPVMGITYSTQYKGGGQNKYT